MDFTPDFSFDDYAKEQAKSTINAFLSEGTIKSISNGNVDNQKSIKDAIETKFYSFNECELRLVYLKELLIHLSHLKILEQFDYQVSGFINYRGGSNTTAIKVKNESYYSVITDLQFFIYNLAASIGYSFNKNAFTINETVDLTIKIDDILYKLDELKAGQEVLFEEFEAIRTAIKKEFESLKSELPLGKKTFFQLALGKIGSFVGDKTADMIFEQLKPYIIAFFATQAPHLLAAIEKALQQNLLK